MSYTLSAFIAELNVLHAVSEQYPPMITVPLKQGFGLIPMTSQVAQYFEYESKKDVGQDEFYWLSPYMTLIAAKASTLGKIAYIEAEFFGGAGHQASILWGNGAVLFGPLWAERLPISEMPINRVLRLMGVRVENSLDEFATLELGVYRATDAWLKNL
jgi:hypothetical protein